MSGSVSIRIATTADAELLARLNDHVHAIHVAAEPTIYRVVDPEAIAAWFAERLSRPEIEVLIADVSGEAAGYAVTNLVDRPRNEFAHAMRYVLVDQLAVDPSRRRQGIGRQLMEAVHERARERGVSFVELEVRGFNEDAARFYETLGYRVRSRRMTREP